MRKFVQILSAAVVPIPVVLVLVFLFTPGLAWSRIGEWIWALPLIAALLTLSGSTVPNRRLVGTLLGCLTSLVFAQCIAVAFSQYSSFFSSGRYAFGVHSPGPGRVDRVAFYAALGEIPLAAVALFFQVQVVGGWRPLIQRLNRRIETLGLEFAWFSVGPDRTLTRLLAYGVTAVICLGLARLLFIPMFVFFALGTRMVFSSERWRRLVASGVTLSLDLYVIWGVLSYWSAGQSFCTKPGTLSTLVMSNTEWRYYQRSSHPIDTLALMFAAASALMLGYLLWYDYTEPEREWRRKRRERAEALERRREALNDPVAEVIRFSRADELDAPAGWDEGKR